MRFALLGLLSALVLAGCVAPVAETDDLDSGLAGDSLPQSLATFVKQSLQIDARWSGEPSILAMRDGTLLITGAGGLTRYAEDPSDAPGNAGQSYLWRSTDDGTTWTFIDLGLPGPSATLLPYRNAIAGVEGDLAEDEAGRAYFVDLTALAGNGLSASDDSGTTWLATQTPLVGLPGADRPWVAAMGDGIVYVKYLQTSSGHRVARSTDAGLTFLEDVEIPGCGQGAPVVDFALQEVIIPCVVGGTDLSILRTSAGTMDWARVPVATAAGPANNVFTAVAVAGPGQYVFAWSERVDGAARLQVASSGDHGATWSDPVTVSSLNSTAVFPWVDANADGVVGVVWYETAGEGAPDEIDGTWYPMHASMRIDPITGNLTAPATVSLSEEPVHAGAICTSGLGCVLAGKSRDRRLLDFFEVDVDDAGRSHVTWTSTMGDSPAIWYGQVASS